MDSDRSSDSEEEVDDAVALTVDETDECAYPDEPEPDEDVKREDDGAPASSRGSCKPATAKRRRTVTKSSGFQFSFLTLKRQAWPEAKVAIVDLFCCIGGYSTGAVQAGHSIALAVDDAGVRLRLCNDIAESDEADNGPSGYGLGNLRTRMEELNGELILHREPGPPARFCVEARLAL